MGNYKKSELQAETIKMLQSECDGSLEYIQPMGLRSLIIRLGYRITTQNKSINLLQEKIKRLESLTQKLANLCCLDKEEEPASIEDQKAEEITPLNDDTPIAEPSSAETTREYMDAWVEKKKKEAESQVEIVNAKVITPPEMDGKSATIPNTSLSKYGVTSYCGTCLSKRWAWNKKGKKSWLTCQNLWSPCFEKEVTKTDWCSRYQPDPVLTGTCSTEYNKTTYACKRDITIYAYDFITKKEYNENVG